MSKEFSAPSGIQVGLVPSLDNGVGPYPDGGEVICTRCQTSNPRDVNACVKCGSFVKGTQAARTTGIYARNQPPDLRASADDLAAGITADLGGESELTTLQIAYVRKIADIEVTLRLLTSDIATNGLLTPGGRVRGVYDKLLAGLAAFDRYAMRVGLERRTKPVDPLEAVRRAVAEANRGR